MSDYLLIAGVLILCFSLRSFQSVLLQKLGTLGIIGTSLLAGWLLSGSPWVGLFCAATWLLMPWLEILTRVRHLRLPAARQIQSRPAPSADRFPALRELSGDVEEEGFEHVADLGWEWEEQEQFYRLFYHPGQRATAAICLAEQAGTGFYFVSLTSRDTQGRVWLTWNYPFSNSLRLPPNLRVQRTAGTGTFFEMVGNHQGLLLANHLEADQLVDLPPADLQRTLQEDLHQQISYNLETGVLATAGEGFIRYTWRGLFYLWFQFLRDLVRLS